MAYTTFINLFTSLDQALDFDKSPVLDPFLKRRTGIRLLPGNPLPYIQVTQNPAGVEIEDWTVKVITPCGEELADITPHFIIEEPFDDDKGIPQVVWSLKNVPNDFGVRVVMLKITQTVGEIYYSNPFQLTAYESEMTERFDYRESVNDYMQSVQILTHFLQWKNGDVTNQRKEKSTGDVRSLTVRRDRIKRMFTDMLPNWLMERFISMLENRYVYMGLTRHYLYEGVEIPDILGSTNFAELEYFLSPIPSESYDPLFVPDVPPIPVPGDQIPFDITAYVRPGQKRTYRMKFNVITVPGYETLLFNFCSANINGQNVSFNPVLSSVSNGIINVLTNYADEVLPINTATLASFQMRVTNGTDYLDYIYLASPVTFTQTDIANAITKQVNATITQL